jgi:hypothetical protein
MLLSAGTSRLGILTDYLLPANARLQNLVGGASQALNVRIARWLLQQTTSENLCFDHAEALLQKAIEQQPQITRRSGKPITDEEAISYIQEALEQNGKAAHTPLLRRLRKEGYACEQKRFKALFNQAKQDWQESSEPQNLELFGGLHGKLMEGGAK